MPSLAMLPACICGVGSRGAHTSGDRSEPGSFVFRGLFSFRLFDAGAILAAAARKSWQCLWSTTQLCDHASIAGSQQLDSPQQGKHAAACSTVSGTMSHRRPNMAKNSLLPELRPGTGDSHRPCRSRPAATAADVTLSTTAACTAASVTTPPGSTCGRMQVSCRRQH